MNIHHAIFLFLASAPGSGLNAVAGGLTGALILILVGLSMIIYFFVRAY